MSMELTHFRVGSVVDKALRSLPMQVANEVLASIKTPGKTLGIVQDACDKDEWEEWEYLYLLQTCGYTGVTTVNCTITQWFSHENRRVWTVEPAPDYIIEELFEGMDYSKMVLDYTECFGKRR